jgi:hypothetical protein
MSRVRIPSPAPLPSLTTRRRDSAPNRRPGAERDAVGLARPYDPALGLDSLFEDFLAGSASIITERTERSYRYDFGIFRVWLDETKLEPDLGSITKANL